MSIRKPEWHGKKWRVGVTTGKKVKYTSFEHKWEADEEYRRLKAQEGIRESPIDLYVSFKATRCLAGSVDTTRFRLSEFFAGVSQITLDATKKAYAHRVGLVSGASSRAELSEVKTFLRWAFEHGLVEKFPLDEIKPHLSSKRNKGKRQLRPGEARRLLEHCMIDQTDESVAIVLAMVFGMRASEIVHLRVGDVDTYTATIVIEHAKTRAGERLISIPSSLMGLFLPRVQGRKSDEYLLPAYRGMPHYRGWVRSATRKACRALGLTQVCAHGLRGTHASLSRLAGIAAEEICRQMGHESYRVTREHYITSSAEQTAQVAIVADRLGINPKSRPSDTQCPNDQLQNHCNFMELKGIEPSASRVRLQEEGNENN